MLEVGPEDVPTLRAALLDAIHRDRNDWTVVSRLYRLQRQLQAGDE